MWDKVGAKNWKRPLVLQPDNFTPAKRTPWGGRRIVDELKADSGVQVDGVVGEAWELSVEPDFPSRLSTGERLDEVLARHPALLGREAPLRSTALLVKLIDTADDLSLQIHPFDDDPALAPDESGKPEAWYVIDAEPGAGLYLGFHDGVSADDVARTIAEEGDLDALMPFVPVSPGDVFVIEPGTPHSIGKGILLLEPQRVLPGRRGITYRYWDWNRRYDPDGTPDPSGHPRALQSERALAVTDWEGPRGDALVDRIRYPAGPAATDDDASLETLTSKTGPLRSSSFLLRRLAGTGHIELPPEDRLRSLTVLDGTLTLHDGESTVELRRGQTAALPASEGPLDVDLEEGHALLCTLA